MLQERVLSCLEQNRGKLVTGGGLARELGVSRTAVWKAIHALEAKGHEIESVAGSGYRLADESDGLSVKGITDLLTTKVFGRELELHQSLPSTNTYIKGLDTLALPEGFAVIADEQTAGRGRLGRTFYSPAREGVYLSVLLKPQLALEEVPLLTICAAVAVSRAIERVCGISPEVKWVNDIFYKGKKLCGILSEGFVSAELGQVESVVVGMGINTGDVDPAVAEIATSLAEAAGVRGIRNWLAAEMLNCFEEVYNSFTSGGRREILGEYSGRLFITGWRVEVVGAGVPYSATVLGIDDSGALLVKNASGQKKALRTGEIRLLAGKGD